MPPAIPIIAAMAASGLGAAAGGAAADAFGGLLATDVLGGASLGATLGGALGGGATGALMDKSDPLLGGVLGGVGGAVGGPGIASGVENAATSVGSALGIGSSAAPSAAAATTGPAVSGIAPAAGGAASIAPPAGTTAATDLTASAPVIAAGTTPVAPAGGGIAPLADTIQPPSAQSVLGQLTPNPAVQPGAPLIQYEGETSGDVFMNQPSWSNALGVLKSNPGAAIGGLGLGYSLLNQGSIPGMGAVQTAAQQAQKTSQELSSYINTGNLPPGFQAAMDQAKQAAKAQVRSKYAAMGMSGSSAEAQDLGNVDIQAVAAQAQVGAQLLQSGISESGVAAELLNQILGVNQTQEADTTQAIMNFAAAMGGTPIMQQTRVG